MKKLLTTTLTIALLLSATGCANSSKTIATPKPTTSVTSKPIATSKPIEQSTSSSAAQSSTSSTNSTNSTNSTVPTEYKSALKKAQSYSDTMHMSKAGLYDQLTSEYGEKFSAEAAQYAIDNVNADWKNNALKKAESYQETMSMSPAAIYDQLISDYGEKFTAEEAQFAVDNLK